MSILNNMSETLSKSSLYLLSHNSKIVGIRVRLKDKFYDSRVSLIKDTYLQDFIRKNKSLFTVLPLSSIDNVLCTTDENETRVVEFTTVEDIEATLKNYITIHITRERLL